MSAAQQTAAMLLDGSETAKEFLARRKVGWDSLLRQHGFIELPLHTSSAHLYKTYNIGKAKLSIYIKLGAAENPQDVYWWGIIRSNRSYARPEEKTFGLPISWLRTKAETAKTLDYLELLLGRLRKAKAEQVKDSLWDEICQRKLDLK